MWRSEEKARRILCKAQPVLGSLLPRDPCYAAKMKQWPSIITDQPCSMRLPNTRSEKHCMKNGCLRPRNLSDFDKQIRLLLISVSLTSYSNKRPVSPPQTYIPAVRTPTPYHHRPFLPNLFIALQDSSVPEPAPKQHAPAKSCPSLPRCVLLQSFTPSSSSPLPPSRSQ